MPAPAHQPISSNSLDRSAPKEANRRNVHASGTLQFGYECVFKFLKNLCDFDDFQNLRKKKWKMKIFGCPVKMHPCRIF